MDQNNNGAYGVIHEVGDLGLGFNELDKKDQEQLRKDEEYKKQQQQNQRSY